MPADVLIQYLNSDTGEWSDYGTCDPEKAGRLIGYGGNAAFYRAVDPVTREVITPGATPDDAPDDGAEPGEYIVVNVAGWPDAAKSALSILVNALRDSL